jgi:hypothetical protein
MDAPVWDREACSPDAWARAERLQTRPAVSHLDNAAAADFAPSLLRSLLAPLNAP